MVDVDREKEETSKRKDKAQPKKRPMFTAEELQEKFARSFNAVAFFLKLDKTYSESDFTEEAKDLIRLAEKYPVIGDVLTWLDPLFLLLGLLSKINEMVQRTQERKRQKREADEARKKEQLEQWPQ